MRIALVTVGSRGDVQPFIALGAGLKRAGYDVTLVTHDEFETPIRGNGLDFAPVSGNPRDMLESETGRQWLESSRNPLTFFKRWRELAEPFADSMMRDVMRGTENADLMLASTLGLFAVPSVSEARGTPYIPTPLQPLQPSSYVGNAAFPLVPGWLPFKGAYNRFSYSAARRMMWTMFGKMVNRARKTVLNLPPTTIGEWFPNGGLPVIYGFSQHVVPKPPDWSSDTHLAGFWHLGVPPAFEPPASLVDFLRNGTPPVYVGFGSMTNRDAQATTELVLEALRLSGQRGLLLTGWGGISNLNLPDDVYKIESVPHDWLFPRMAAVVHHGGAGTTAAGLRAGVPCIIVPFFADQPFWGSRVEALGVGPKPILRKRLTAQKLADAITRAVTDQTMRQRAAALGETLRAEDSIGNAVRALESELDKIMAKAKVKL